MRKIVVAMIITLILLVACSSNENDTNVNKRNFQEIRLFLAETEQKIYMPSSNLLKISTDIHLCYWTEKCMHSLMAQIGNMYITSSTRKMYIVQ